MRPVEFPESNKTLLKPESMTDEECSSLPIYTDGLNCVSCWEITEEEVEVLKSTKKIWLTILSGKSQPPVCLQVESPFSYINKGL